MRCSTGVPPVKFTAKMAVLRGGPAKMAVLRVLPPPVFVIYGWAEGP